MKKSLMLFFVGLLTVIVLAACGEKSQTDVVNALEKKIEEMSGYKAKGKMTLETGSEPQEYEIEIWHKEPDFYRVNLKNSQKEQSQMILRNDDGVFVLTPALNKSFRFQSEWPQNSSQAYLYESLIQDIVNDPETKFTASETNYVFETKTNYQNNKMLPTQEITFNKKDLSPATVKVMDTDRKALVVVQFSEFEFNASFDDNAFDVEKNMSSAQIEIPTMATGDNESFAVKYPLEQPEGVSLIEEKEVETENGKRVILTFGGGDKSFTLIQENAEIAAPASASTSTYVNGQPTDLGFAIGAMSDNSLTWTHDGVDYMLASEDLTEDEMLMVAKSVQGQTAK
ncbi:outer membrane lipoprotein-sorting protein [Metabacillus malikii]|uniref:Outer membrane lipoprotein-sorting protein n=1 Tax=Metabacillus malikii TaxID=1504265 RepID=A0ABT9ZJN9_9BACI|nr:outer membrane lipoprotein-sorting protein [Metabacillus malikii]